MYKLMAQVTAEQNDNGDAANITISIPEASDNMSSETLMYLFCSAVGLCIKSMHNAGTAKDYEMVKAAVDYIHTEFSSPRDFEDAAKISNHKLKDDNSS